MQLKTLILTFTLPLIISCQSSAMEVPLISWDMPDTGEGLRVHGIGFDKLNSPWFVREPLLEDMAFYKEIYGEPKVMSSMGSGRTFSAHESEERVKRAVETFAQGYPYAGMAVLNEFNEPLGGIQLTINGKPGVGEIVRLFTPSSQGQGLGTSTLKFLVEEWAPAVRKIGLGEGLNTPPAATEKFQCFEGKALETIYTTAKPSNIASWQCYKHVGFQPCLTLDTSFEITCENQDLQMGKMVEDYVYSTYFSPTALHPLKEDTLYSMIDEQGTMKTISFVKKYNSLRYHFERPIQ